MNTIDLSPLYRSSIGFDRFGSLLDAALRANQATTSYPPYNIEVIDDNRYDISLAVAGFDMDDLDIQVEKGVLTVRGKKEDSKDRQYLYHGIATRAFEQKFNLADYVEVTGARMHNGLLIISLVKEIPEAMKPRRIEIESDNKVIEHKVEKDRAA